MNKFKLRLPTAIKFTAHKLQLDALTESDKQFYFDIYSNKDLMKYINEHIDTKKILNNFDTLLAETENDKPAYVSYVINHESSMIGIFGIKVLAYDVVEIGVIILSQFQGQGWSRKLKLLVIDCLFKKLNVKSIVTYCHHNNAAVNHINQSIGFTIKKQFEHKTKKYLMNKWVCKSLQKNN